MAAGNRAQDKGVVNQMPAALANRMIHFEVTSSVDDWKLWAIPNQIDHRVISFLNFRPELLYRLPSQAAEIKAFPSPRSWEFVHKILPSYGQADKAFPAICGAVGEVTPPQNLPPSAGCWIKYPTQMKSWTVGQNDPGFT
ncbi:MAG: hypothetical protein RQM92_02820 [Candidatus Syntrophopropionicum ammoniitolerans]